MNNSSLWIILQRMRLPFTVIVITYAISMIGLLIIPGVDANGHEYHLSIFDAFYFTTYTATTIGFGEIPYELTHAQRIWVSMSIYLTVLGWFYGIGTLVSLLQDKLFLDEIAVARFKKAVKNIKEDFVIVLGYDETTSQIIQKLLTSNIRVVVIEKNQQKADYLRLEGFVPHVPVLVKNVHYTSSLEYAGIRSIHCKGVISLLKDSILNLRVTLASKILNPNVKVAVSATTPQESGNLLDVGANIVENPFEIISHQIQMAFKTPSLFKLNSWLYKIEKLDAKVFSIPNEKIIVCGYGRFGTSLVDMFVNNGITPTIIEIDKQKVESAKRNGVENIICGNAEDQYYLNQANIHEAKMVVVATQNDTTNLSIVSTVKKMNKKIYIISRENELSDFSIFSHANIDYIFIPSQILIHKITNAFINPLCDAMIKLIKNKDESWGDKLLANLIKTISINPTTYELYITKDIAPELYKHISNKKNITLQTLRRSRRNRDQLNNLVALLIIKDDKNILMPSWDTKLDINDKILFACDQNALDDIEMIINNMYEFHYIVYGKERKNILRWKS